MSDRTAPPPVAERLPSDSDSAHKPPSVAENDSMTAQRVDTPVGPQPPPDVADGADETLQNRPHDRRWTFRWPNSDRRESARSPKAHLFVTLCHWSMVFLLTCSMLSGMRMGWGFIESPLIGPTGFLSRIANAITPTGTMFGINLITFHIWSVFLMFAVTGVYLVYLFRSRASKRLQLTLKDLKNLTPAGIRVNGFWRYKQALWSANLLTYWLAFAILGVLLVTGFSLYRPDWELATVLGGHQAARYIHGLFAYLLIPYIVLHSVLQWCFGRFWTIFKAQFYRPHVMAGLVGVAVGVPVAWGLYAWDSMPMDTLTVKRIPSGVAVPVLDGKANDAAWNSAQAVIIHTTKGVNNPEEDVDVSVKAVYDGENVYFQYQWADPDVSYKRYPLIKTAEGWKMLQNAFEWADENEYYEDKLAMYITDVKNGACATTCHLGVGPDAEKGLKHGLHYTAGETGDVWHWKAIRTNPMGDLLGEPGYADDQHFHGADPIPAQITKRYTAGYYPDPNTGGGYKYNFDKIDPSKPISETFVRPLMLPPSDSIRPNSDPKTSDYGTQWWIHKSKGIKYSPELDTYPVGTLIPSMLIEPFQGDEADVRAKGDWQRGVWTLELKRVLDTKSKFDVAFSTERPVYISLGTFNRSQTRHSEHIKPVKVVLE
jgi:thiosulfate reductase cytochrome b subunit